LTCQLHPKSGSGLEHSGILGSVQDQAVEDHHHGQASARLSDSTLSLTLKGDELNKLSFLPGQYANLEVPGTDQHRAYSSVRCRTTRSLLPGPPIHRTA